MLDFLAAIGATFFVGLPIWLWLIGPDALAEREVQRLRDATTDRP